MCMYVSSMRSEILPGSKLANPATVEVAMDVELPDFVNLQANCKSIARINITMDGNGSLKLR